MNGVRILEEALVGAQGTLLDLAAAGLPRPLFLERALAALRDLTGAEILRLSYEDGGERVEWREARGAVEEIRFHVRPPEDSVEPDNPDALRFRIDPSHTGWLELEPLWAPGEEMEPLRRRLARTLGVVLAIQRSQSALAERVKEITCMYHIAQVAADAGLSLKESCRMVVRDLPAAWQYPEVARARILLDGFCFVSEGFCEGPARLQAPIRVGGVERGRVEIFYSSTELRLAGRHVENARTFLPEEHALIEGVARELAHIVERRSAEAERKKLQEQVLHADRLATIGQLAAGLAHELNEPLGGILGFSQLLGKSPRLCEEDRTDVYKIRDASLIAREVVQKLLLFARQAPPRRSAVDMEELFRSALGLLESRARSSGVAFQRSGVQPAPRVYGDRAQLLQVLVNLLVNAVQASKPGQTVELDVTCTERTLRLSVSDSGEGIPAENLERIFLPFFTTKSLGEGTGLGLAVSHGIVLAHGGTIHAENRPGGGALFRLALPLGPTRKQEQA